MSSAARTLQEARTIINRLDSPVPVPRIGLRYVAYKVLTTQAKIFRASLVFASVGAGIGICMGAMEKTLHLPYMQLGIMAGAAIGFLLGMIKTHIDMAREIRIQANNRIDLFNQRTAMCILLLEQDRWIRTQVAHVLPPPPEYTPPTAPPRKT
ncbi:MAG: hypothetical protein OXF02_06730 [Simkaniaceae bacterium]|nr:hypothetical protein [Simkaniaceae bacterium]